MYISKCKHRHIYVSPEIMLICVETNFITNLSYTEKHSLARQRTLFNSLFNNVLISYSVNYEHNILNTPTPTHPSTFPSKLRNEWRKFIHNEGIRV